jgi:membrane-associated protease RseP (regulator of RpoE activity)
MARSVTTFWVASLSVILGLAVPGLAQNSEKPGESQQSGVTTLADPSANPLGTWELTGNLMNGTNQGNLAWWAFAHHPAGMELVAADDSLREHLKLPKDQGLVVLTLDPQSSPAQAGIQQNDVLLLVGDAPVAKPEELDDRLKKAGEEPVALTVLRGGKRLKLQVQPQLRVTLGPVQAEPPAFWIGVSVTPVGPALRSQLQLAQDKGLAVIDIVKESSAERAGIKLHDIILSFAGKPLPNQEQLVELVQKNGDKSAALELIREGKTQTIEITPQRRKADRLHANVKNGPVHYYQFVRPGAVFDYSSRNPGSLKVDPSTQTLRWTHDVKEKLSEATETKDAVSKRLDQLDAELSQLRKAIEELSKAVKDK